MPSHSVAEQVQRGLDRERIRLNTEEVVRRGELPVELAPSLDVARQSRPYLLRDLWPDDVRVDADPADPAELRERLYEGVVACIEVEAGVDDVLRLREIVSGSMLTTTRLGML